MREAKTAEARPIPPAPVGFPEIDASLNDADPAAAIDRLVADLETSGNYRMLLDALLLKARHDLGLPLIQVGRYAELADEDRIRFEERYVEALRRVGSKFLEVDDVSTAWAYFQAIGEPEAVRKAIDALATPEDPDRLASLIEVAFHQGANPIRGFEWLLRAYGPCSAITSLEQVSPSDPAVRTACVERLIRHLHEQLVDNLRADVTRRGQPQPPAKASIAQIIEGRDWLFSEDSYHTDVSHLSTVVRWAVMATDPEALGMALDLAEYGRRLSPRLQYDGTPPFEKTFDDHRIYLKALCGRDVDQAVEHFRAKLPANAPQEEGDLESTLPAQTLVNLLARVDRIEEAVEVSAKYLAEVPDSVLACPPLAELCQRSGRLDRLAETAIRLNNPVHYLAARIQSPTAGPSREP